MPKIPTADQMAAANQNNYEVVRSWLTVDGS